MSSALGGAGGGGLFNTTQSTNANVAVYSSKLKSSTLLEKFWLTSSAFAVLAFFGGKITIYNRVGIKICLMFGGFGYACLASAYFTTAHISDRATDWVVTAGCLEGLSAAMVSHPGRCPILNNFHEATNSTTAVDSTGCRNNELPH
jgi:hypothetical protein